MLVAVIYSELWSPQKSLESTIGNFEHADLKSVAKLLCTTFEWIPLIAAW